MRRRRDLPDTKIVPFPDNSRGDDSPAAHRASWGPDHDIRPLVAGEVVLIERGNLIATFTLRIRVGSGVAFYFRGFRLVRWGPGERVFPPQRRTTVRVTDDDGKFIRARDYYADLITFDSNRGAKAFEEAALAAARYAVARHRSDQRAFVDDGAANADVPF
jgi:hypothetical protein